MKSLSDRIKQLELLSNERGIQNILEKAYIVLENPIVMYDTEYRLQAYTRVISDDPIWNEIISYGSFSYESQLLFMEFGFVDAVANAETTVLLLSDKLKYERITGKLYNENNIHVSNLTIIASDRPFNDDDLLIFEALCKLMSAELSRSELYKTYGTMYREAYIRKLIDGEITEKALYAAHIAIVYSGFKSSMRLIIADIGINNPGEYSKLTYYRDLFRQTQSTFEYAIYSNYILIVASSDNEEFDAVRDLGKIYELFEKYNIYGGVSNSFDNMYELQKYYLEAVAALNRGLSENLSGHLFLYCESNKRN